MSKRKRGDDEVQELAVDSVKARRVEHKLKLGATKVGHAFKVAKGFERQKLGRRQKTAVSRSDVINVERIDSEIGALKALDTTAAAQQQLFKTLLKIKAVAEHPDLPAQVKNASKGSFDHATLNVVARLCNSNQGKAALDAAVVDIQKALGVRTDRLPTAEKKKRKRVEEAQNTTASEGRRGPADRQTASNDDQLQSKGALDAAKDSNDDSEAGDDLSNRSRDETGDEFSDVEDLEQRLLDEAGAGRAAKSNSPKYDVQADLSLSESDSGRVSASPEPQKAASKSKKSFLPSLTMGGYISGSDSDVEDIDIAPKKNRRGQRARQQIWEQKYGNNAKHLQKEGHAIEFDRKRGAVEKNGRGRGNFGRKGTGRASNAAGGDRHAANTAHTERKKTHRDDGGALHPSWEAAKKSKEKKEAPIAFSGKKITFG